MNLPPHEQREWALQRQQQLIREGQECYAAERQALRQLGKALHWLGSRFMAWGQRLQAQQQTMELQGN